MIGQLLRFKELSMNDPSVNRAEINKRIAEFMGFKDIPKLIVPAAPIDMKQGALPAMDQQRIQQRLAEGASPEQIKAEMLGPRPNDEQPQGA